METVENLWIADCDAEKGVLSFAEGTVEKFWKVLENFSFQLGMWKTHVNC